MKRKFRIEVELTVDGQHDQGLPSQVSQAVSEAIVGIEGARMVGLLDMTWSEDLPVEVPFEEEPADGA